MNAVRPDPAGITDRAELAAALRTLRESSGVTYRELVERSGGLHGTVSGWFSGHHLPIKASADMFDRVLVALGVDDKVEREQWWDAVRRVRSAPSRTSSARGPAPYKGLESFEAHDADWFFGRADVVDALQARVRAVADAGGGVVVVLGASGSGKSSVLRAGLARTIEGSRVRSGIADIRDYSQHPSAEKILIFDQFEELWTATTDDDRRHILGVVDHLVSSGAVIVIGLRADFYQSAVAEDVLTTGLVDNPIVLGRLRPDQLRDVIVEPARKAGTTVDDALLRTLLGEMEPTGSVFAHDQGALPMLSHALLATWQSAAGRTTAGRTMTVDDYYATGGLPGAVQQTAEKAYSSLTPEQQEAARRLFVRLVNIDDDALTRRRVARVELFGRAGTDSDVDTVIETFTAARLLTVEEESVSVTHEVLLTAWDRLRRWIDDDRQWHLTHRRLTDAAVMWNKQGRDNSGLLPARTVETLEESLGEGDRENDLNESEREFLGLSRARLDQQDVADRRRRRVLQGLGAALVVATVVAVTLAGVAFSARSEADLRRIDAEAALSGQLAGVAERLRESDPGLSVNLALAAYETNPTLSATSALLDASAIHAPVRLPGVPGEARARIDASGRTIAVAGADGSIRLWSIGDGPARQRGRIDLGIPGSAVGLAFAPEGTTIAAGGASGTSLWNVADLDTPVQTAAIGDVSTTSKAIAFAPDGRRIALVSPLGAVSVWDISDPEAIARVADLPVDAPAIATVFSPDGSLLVTAGGACSLRVWDARNLGGPPLFSGLPDGSTYDYLALAFAPDGRTLAAGTTGREVVRWSVDPRGGLTILPALTGFTSYVNDVAFDAAGSVLTAVSSDNSIRMWDAPSGVLRETLPGGGVVMSATYSPDGTSLITAGQDGITRIWPLPGPVGERQGDNVYITPIDGAGTKIVAGVGKEGRGLSLWDLTDPDRPESAARPLTATTSDPLTGAAAISWDGTLAAGGTASGGFQLWNTSDVRDPQPIGQPHPAVRSLVAALAFTKTGDVLAVSPQNTTDVSLWDVRDPAQPQELSGFELGNNPQVMAFSPDGRTLAVPTLGDVVELWDVEDPSAPRRLTTLEGFEDDGTTVAFSPDGRLLAGASADRSVRLWDVGDPSSPTQVARIAGPREVVYSLAFDPDGTRLAGGVGDGSLWIWDVENASNPQPYATLTAYGARVNDAVFTDGGAAMVSGGSAQNLRVWRTDPDEVADRICAGGGLSITEDEWAQYLPGSTFRALC